MAAQRLSDLGLRPWVYENPQHVDSFWFERVDANELRYWARKQLPACGVICVIYVLFVHYGPLWMKNRKPYNLRTQLVVWNLLLAIFSFVGVLRTIPELFHTLKMPNGFHRSVCGLVGRHYPATFWGMAFTVSKIAELGDTIFIVLRKKPVTFLHWFHHSTVLLGSFWGFSEGEPAAGYGMLLNYSVHSIMYSYFAVKTLKINVPRTISMIITSIQISQLLAGFYVHMYSTIIFVSGGDCHRTENSLIISFVLLFSYIFLFGRLFYISYITKSKTKNC